MSADISMSSDDDQPLARAGPSKPNGRSVANGKTNGRVESDSDMSEDDDVPLVRFPHTSLFWASLIILSLYYYLYPCSVPKYAYKVGARIPATTFEKEKAGTCIFV